MLSNMLSALAGAAAVTAAVLLSGANARFVFALGFLAAIVVLAAAVYLIGAANVARGFNAFARWQNSRPLRQVAARQDAPPAVRARKEPPAAATALSPLEREVVSALMNMGSRKPAAIAAATAARNSGAQDFESLFRAALRAGKRQPETRATEGRYQIREVTA